MATEIDQSTFAALLARHQISDAIKRVGRGADRLDKELMLTGFHPGAIDNHGYHVGTCEEHAEIMERRHKAEVLNSVHLLGESYIEIDGEKAAAETYFFAVQRTQRAGNTDDFMAAGRYLDRCELRNGEWRIAERNLLIDWTNRDGDPNVSQIGRGQRTREDLSYQMLKSGLAMAG
jgi:hypothetical protein